MPFNAPAHPAGAGNFHSPYPLSGEIVADKFSVRNIPHTMHLMGWNVAAALMEHWFRSPSFIMTKELHDKKLTPEKWQYNDTIVKMAWVFNSSKVWQAEAKAFRKNWLNYNLIKLENYGLKNLKGQLVKKGWYSGCKQKIVLEKNSSALECEQTCTVKSKWLSSGVPQIAKDMVEQLKGHEGADNQTLKDLFGALGSAELTVAVCGHTYIREDKEYFRIESTGIYLRDTFDFGDYPTRGKNWFEPLGVWSKEGILDKKYTALYFAGWAIRPVDTWIYSRNRFFCICNGDFQEWRRDHSQGGDFVVYSDVVWEDCKDDILLGRIGDFHD
jgi:hypothetical protein